MFIRVIIDCIYKERRNEWFTCVIRFVIIRTGETKFLSVIRVSIAI